MTLSHKILITNLNSNLNHEKNNTLQPKLNPEPNYNTMQPSPNPSLTISIEDSRRFNKMIVLSTQT